VIYGFANTITIDVATKRTFLLKIMSFYFIFFSFIYCNSFGDALESKSRSLFLLLLNLLVLSKVEI